METKPSLLGFPDEPIKPIVIQRLAGADASRNNENSGRETEFKQKGKCLLVNIAITIVESDHRYRAPGRRAAQHSRSLIKRRHIVVIEDEFQVPAKSLYRSNQPLDCLSLSEREIGHDPVITKDHNFPGAVMFITERPQEGGIGSGKGGGR
jgi:hypothetical protein